MKKILYRNDQNQMISGVCSGLAEYLDLDTGVVRAVTALLLILSGTTIAIVYLVFALVLPTKSQLEHDGKIGVKPDFEYKSEADRKDYGSNKDDYATDQDEYAFDEDDYKW